SLHAHFAALIAMASLIFILVSLALLGGFLMLSEYEARKGTRVFARERARLDEQVERVEFIFAHVNFTSFLREESLRLAHRVAHDIAHLSLQAVRAVERLLTQVVQYLRSRHAVDVMPRENAREFVKTLSDFKGHLETTHPKIPDIL
ncbi:MAG: hypothetical protein Q8O94_01735, partial [bacterium]|nr:hypothetical protein [bacterium]